MINASTAPNHANIPTFQNRPFFAVLLGTDQELCRRLQNASDGSWGSDPWKNMPIGKTHMVYMGI